MPTSKELRAPPTQDFDKYFFTRATGPEARLFPIASSAMWEFSNTASDGGEDETSSPTTPIGFNFKFNEKIYDRFVAHTNGFIILREVSDTGTFDLDDYLPEYPDNTTVLSEFTTNGVLLCPWLDDLKSAYTDVTQLGLPSLKEEQDIQRGIIAPDFSLNPTTSALKYVNTNTPAGGRCLVVRWRSLNSYANPSSVITFEVVIYESGKIEFRYAPKQNITTSGSDADNEGATICIFLNDRENPDSTFWRFRDLSVGLGHPSDKTRLISKYGGCEYDSTYTDSWDVVNKPYNITLFTSNVKTSTVEPSLKGRYANWPGQDLFGCVMTFSPPANRRKVLPRKDLVQVDSRQTYPLIARTGDVQRMGTYLSMYDDRRALVYGQLRVADYPTTLPRDYANTEMGAPDRQNLYGDLEMTASTAKSVADSFIGNVPVEYVKPFSDHHRPEQDPNSGLDVYYLTGSSIELFGTDLIYPLKSKTQIKMELPLQHQLQMLETGSAIYYYNSKAKGMFVPQSGDAPSDIMHATASTEYQTEGKYWPEDARCFGPISNVVASGSNPGAMDPYWSSDPEFGHDSEPWFQNTASLDLLTRTYEKNVQINDDYRASQDEQIIIPINQPFILEKAVFELPLILGQGWFEDRTTSSTPIGVCSSTADDSGISIETFDFAGPALTIALFNQISNGHTTHRDLILTGSIIPAGDNSGNIAVRQSWSKDGGNIYPVWLFEPEGFVKYDATPSAVIEPNEDNTFTGSVLVPTVAGLSNGVVLRQEMRASYFENPTPYQDVRAKFVKDFMTSPEISIYEPSVSGGGKTYIGFSNVKSVNPFSRDSRGTNISGRSLFGKEHTTYQTTKNGRVSNPLFVSSSFDDFPVALKSVLDTSINPEFQSWFQYAIPVDKSTPSPYLLLPGDKLIFAISKNRPTIHTNGHFPVADVPVDFWRGGLRHDAWINTGSIKVTLYGSLLKEGKEFHDPLNQSLNNSFVHETLGSEPVCDQFQVEYDDGFYGTYTDSCITGSLFSFDAKRTEYTVDGSTVTKVVSNVSLGPTRGSVSSKMDARDAAYVSTEEDYLLNGSKSRRLQPLYEKVGTQRTLRISSNMERFYDSLMPDFSECLSLNGKFIHYLPDPDEIFQTEIGSYDRDKSYGVIFLDSESDSGDFTLMNDRDWGYGFPFEPRYSSAQRKQQLVSTFISALSADILPINSAETKYKKIDHLLICQRDGNESIKVMCDVDLNKSVEIRQPPAVTYDFYYVTSSMGHDDMAKVIYGFGDGRMSLPTVYPDYRIGRPQQVLFREEHRTIPATGLSHIDFQYGPLIRGWKYGVVSGLPSYSSAVFNRNRYGQLRDMLEQRLDTKFFLEDMTEDGRNSGVKNSMGSGPINIRFINTSTGETTAPENTWASNLHFEASSSMPYFDGTFTNRTDNFEGINHTMVELTP